MPLLVQYFSSILLLLFLSWAACGLTAIFTTSGPRRSALFLIWSILFAVFLLGISAENTYVDRHSPRSVIAGEIANLRHESGSHGTHYQLFQLNRNGSLTGTFRSSYSEKGQSFLIDGAAVALTVRDWDQAVMAIQRTGDQQQGGTYHMQESKSNVAFAIAGVSILAISFFQWFRDRDGQD